MVYNPQLDAYALYGSWVTSSELAHAKGPQMDTNDPNGPVTAQTHVDGLKAGELQPTHPRVLTDRTGQPIPGTGHGAANAEPILQFFAYTHLPLTLQAISKPFCELAHAIVMGDNVPESGTCTFGGPLPRNPERSVALRKLLEAKDAAVRAALARPS